MTTSINDLQDALADWDEIGFGENVDGDAIILEAAKTLTPRGGYDGILVTFGEGTDDDALNAMFCFPVMKVTLADGCSFDVTNMDSDGGRRPYFGWDGMEDGVECPTFQYRLYDVDPDNPGPSGDWLALPTDQVVGLHIH